ncbi:MAG: hypothetical protein GY904_31780 [Planctomycetaceae bacterium]|nr:hypothetical protein [Planctomycetaceae bacterium]
MNPRHDTHQYATTIEVQPWSRCRVKRHDLLGIAGGTLGHRPPKNEDITADQRLNGNSPGVRQVEIDNDRCAEFNSAETLKPKKKGLWPGGSAGEGF